MEQYYAEKLNESDLCIVTYINGLIETSDEVNEELVETILVYLPELEGCLSVEDVCNVKEIIRIQNETTGETQPMSAPPPARVEQSPTTVTKTLEDELMEEHPYLTERQQIDFLVSKFGKKNIKTVLMVRLSEDENWFVNRFEGEYAKYKRDAEAEKKRERLLKKSLYEKYSESVLNPAKTYKPLILNTRDKMTRYRDGKIVSTRGEKYIFESKEI